MLAYPTELFLTLNIFLRVTFINRPLATRTHRLLAVSAERYILLFHAVLSAAPPGAAFLCALFAAIYLDFELYAVDNVPYRPPLLFGELRKVFYKLLGLAEDFSILHVLGSLLFY